MNEYGKRDLPLLAYLARNTLANSHVLFFDERVEYCVFIAKVQVECSYANVCLACNICDTRFVIAAPGKNLTCSREQVRTCARASPGSSRLFSMCVFFGQILHRYCLSRRKPVRPGQASGHRQRCCSS